MIRAIIHWWQDTKHAVENAPAKAEVMDRLDRIDEKQREILGDLDNIKGAVDPLRQMIEGLRQTPSGFDNRKRMGR